MRQFMQRYDLLLTPSVAVPAFDALPARHSTMDPATMLGWTPFSYPFNLTQQPACSIPWGLTSDGLPIGLQIVGPMFGDALVLRERTRAHVRSPGPRLPACDHRPASGYARTLTVTTLSGQSKPLIALFRALFAFL